MSGPASVSYVTTPPTGPEAPAKTPEQQAADAAAQARATGGAVQSSPQGERPDWLPEQFATVADFVKSSNETRAALTRTQQELAAIKKGEQPKQPDAAAPDAAAQPADDKAKSQDDAAQQIVAKSGLDVSQWQTEFYQTGDVAPAGREKIAEGLKGVLGENARQIVDDYIEGQKVRRSNYENQLFEVAGGKDQYAEMIQWAGASLKPAEVNAFNKAIDSGDLTSASLAIKGLRAQFETERGSNPQLLTGDNSIGSVNAGFSSSFEMTQAMSDKRYGKDPIYTKQVEQRAMRSNF